MREGRGTDKFVWEERERERQICVIHTGQGDDDGGQMYARGDDGEGETKL